ncbi:response regulator, partial [Hansschlegelia beijingensis]|uniref:response regulator n=1 Tax=Hansschlegelia beijingensis TaxID=1133344 RepID=UPI00387F04E3
PRPHAVGAHTSDRLWNEVVDGYFARHKVKPGRARGRRALRIGLEQSFGRASEAGPGVALVSELAHRMGGHAEANDRTSGGAEVAAVVRLEAADPEPHASRPLRILVAEDNAVNQRVIGTLLDHFGHLHDIVEDGAAAVEAAAGQAYDIVLMDAAMPRLDGLAAARAIRALRGPAAKVRIIGVTARAFDSEIRAFLAAGADAVVTKPISVAELWRAIAIEPERRQAG